MNWISILVPLGTVFANPVTYELVRNLVAPEAPKNDLVKTLRAHLKPKPLVIAERFKFYKRTQLQEESVAEYIVTLKDCQHIASLAHF